MKKYIISLLAALSFLTSAAQTADEQVGRMMNEQRWFDLREFYQTNTDSVHPFLDTFARAMLANFFNRPEDAVVLCTELLNSNQLDLGNTLSVSSILSSNLGKLGENAKAAQVMESIYTSLAPYGEQIGPAVMSGIKTTIDLYNAKSGYAMNRLKPFDKEVTAPFRLTPVGSEKRRSVAIDIDGTIDGVPCTMVFDTGAGGNVISDSMAEAMNLDVLDVEIPISGVGNQIARFAVVKELTLGDLTIYNVPFYVVTLRVGHEEADEQMAHYQIVVGRDIMETTKYFSIDFSDNMITFMQTSDIPDTATTNLCMGPEENYMVQCRTFDGLPLLMNPDTGDASFGYIFCKMMPAMQQLAELRAADEKLRWGGAGGYFELAYSTMDDMPLTIEESTVVIPSMPVLMEEAEGYLPGYDGVMGIETFKLFGKVSFDLSRMILYPGNALN